MNKTLGFNDTFDNISFSDLGRCLNDDENYFKKPTELVCNKKTPGKTTEVINVSICKQVTSHDETRTRNISISFDDSQFFSESFTVPSNFVSDSEDLFSESGFGKNIDFSEEFTQEKNQPNHVANKEPKDKNSFVETEDIFCENQEKILPSNSICLAKEQCNDNNKNHNNNNKLPIIVCLEKNQTEVIQKNVTKLVESDQEDIFSDDNSSSSLHIEDSSPDVSKIDKCSESFKSALVNQETDDIFTDDQLSSKEKLQNSAGEQANDNSDPNISIKTDEIMKNEAKELFLEFIRSDKHKYASGNMKEINEKINKTSHGKEELLYSSNSLVEVREKAVIESTVLSDWGLPESILQKYANRKILNMFPWQVECLNKGNVLDMGKNLVYSAPTSAGKTLVAEILAIKTVLEKRKKVLFILPFVSVVREKMFYFQDILGTSGVRVEGYMGSHNPPGDFKTVQVAICTIEKANSLVNRMMGEGALCDIGAIIVDEMHLLGDSSRGYLLELMLTKLKYMSAKEANVQIQIIGMSATLPNLDLLSKWLDAELYTTQFRPIPLYEQCHYNGEIYNSNFKLKRKIPSLPEIENDTDNVLQLCLETIKDSCSVLIFCPTKNWCENLSQQIAMAFWKIGNSKSELGTMLRQQLNSEAICELIEQLKRCPVGLDKILGKTVAFAVAFHHAGLTMDERDIIEGAFRLGTLRVLVATSTLSSGVNLPARRVIIRTPMFHGKPIDTLTYRQMIGRAGRMGKDVAGESILICQKNDSLVAKELMSAHLQPIESCLEGSGKLKRAILEVIASEVSCTPDDVKLFTNCTLLAVHESDDSEIKSCIEDSIEFLHKNEFIRLQEMPDGTSKYVATSLAKACLSSSMPPEEGLALFTELEKARQCFVLDTELHLIYLVTPYSACYQWQSIDWMHFLDLWEQLSTSMKRVGELVGVRESYIINATRGKLQSNTTKLYQKLMVHKRFYTALALQDLVNEVPLNSVAKKFNCSRGMLQSLQQSASSFAGMVTSFSRQLGWSNVELLISQFQDRLQFGVSRDLLDLMRIPILNGVRARALFDAGIETLVQLASSDVCDVENILHKAKPFETEKEREGETEYDLQKRNQIRSVWITGLQGITVRQAAEMLVKDARRYLKLEMGLIDAKWDGDASTSITKNSSQKEIESTPKISLDSNVLADKNSTIDTSKSSLSISLELSPISSQKVDVSEKNELPKSPKSRLQSTDTSKSSVLFDSSNQSLFESSFGEHLNHCINSLNICDESKSANNTKISESDTLGSSFELEDCITVNKENRISDIILTSQEDISSPSLQSLRKRSRNCSPSDNSGTPSKKIRTSRRLKYSKSLKDFGSSPQSTVIYPKDDHNSPVNLTKFEIVNVCDDQKLFECFSKEFSEQFKISFSIACSRVLEVRPVIGRTSAKRDQSLNKSTEDKKFCYKGRRVHGFSISWGGNVVYYVSLENEAEVKNYLKINQLKSVFRKPFLNVRMFDCKEQLKVLKLCCGVDFYGELEDPKVADWILQPEEKEKNLQAMALKYNPEAVSLSQLAGNCKGVGSVGLDLNSCIEPKIRSSVEAIVSWYLVDSVREALIDQDPSLVQIYNIEMKSMMCIARMELDGIGVSLQKLQALADSLKGQIDSIEKKAFQLAGRRFSFSSSTDVAKVLGMYKGKKCSMNKQVLGQIENPISDLIQQWRKLSSTLTKMVYPLLRMVHNGRIHGSCITHNATGRITMHEPNLQNVPRDFNFKNPLTNETTSISCRSSFVASGSNILLSADYCQLELRLLAHLSQDKTLCSIMKSDQDVFKSIAARWNGIKEEEVSDVLRQRAKQICYGIIYGMGQKTLSEQLSIAEEEALDFMNSFHNKYKGIQRYINETIQKCKENGFVETLSGRRRFLPHISHQHPAVQKQAERQAVNTTVQGSAADIAKKAMVLVEHSLEEEFKMSRRKPKLVLHLHDELLYEVPSKHLHMVATILKKCMESSVYLSVPFPVKLKSGLSWGEMTEFSI